MGNFTAVQIKIINGPARGRQSFGLGRLCGYMAAILDLLETYFLSQMIATDGEYLAPHRMDP